MYQYFNRKLMFKLNKLNKFNRVKYNFSKKAYF